MNSNTGPSVSVNGNDNEVLSALGKLRHIMQKEGTFVRLKIKKYHLKCAERKKYKQLQAYNRRQKARSGKIGQVDNNSSISYTVSHQKIELQNQ
ncbi:30S ribosomal protein S21 [Candidatus Deianiraea vastatrix]|uniref:30S ribosomal protein S21 n=1 Tax=Candidatus Deianiraea vastatrix TaxID=2163644 RepID=A0A5B8XD06_9RICK|nr:30S ribosomal protein S21 [Candidatus Deianiraea vastatrix]QED22906.1 30S ribosomal protein S21 [Candidatus Deianiraea vastatrix]QED23077.1 30S ribosomal protein S21 [Candidatus Deianiraea vastatrix]